MAQSWKSNHALFLIVVGTLAWLIPGAGHFTLNERKRGVVIFVVIALTFLAGLYVGSVGVVDPINAKPWYAAQLMNSPAVLLLGGHVADAYRAAHRASEPALAYLVYGRANEIGQIYTSIAGLLNLLCIVNAVYMAHLRSLKEAGA
jgi:hypothetical protein